MLCLTGCDIADWGDSQRYTHDFHYNFPLSTGGKLSLETFNGSVEITAWDQQTVDISGTTHGRTQADADNLKIQIDHTPAAVDIRVARQYDNRQREGAKFIIKVPRSTLVDRVTASNGGIRVEDAVGPSRLRTSNGGVHIVSFKGNLDIHTSNAPVELTDVEGDVIANSSNGHIHATRLEGTLDGTTSNAGVKAEVLRSDRPVRVDTSNGSVDLVLPNGVGRELRVNTSNAGITVRLPDKQNAHVMARTSNSSITTDFDVAARGEIGKHSLDGTLGSGGPLIDLVTSNGGIRLVRM
jgi:DUF4097 and DUF4098 domain-containing protein YvlB